MHKAREQKLLVNCASTRDVPNKQGTEFSALDMEEREASKSLLQAWGKEAQSAARRDALTKSRAWCKAYSRNMMSILFAKQQVVRDEPTISRKEDCVGRIGRKRVCKMMHLKV